MSHLSGKLGGAPGSWTWGRLHTRSFPSITGADGLGYGPRPAVGDPFTEDAADGGLDASVGPSWRMIAALSATGVSAQGVYPGGQSENPASPWYTNLVELWWDGKYLPVPAPGSAAGPVTWSLHGRRLAEFFVTALLCGLTSRIGLWFVPFAAAVCLCALPPRRRGTVPVVAAGAVAGWAVSLWLIAWAGLPVGATARAIAGLAGLPPYAAVTIAVTVALAALQALAGGWLALAVFPRPQAAQGPAAPASATADPGDPAGPGEPPAASFQT